MHETPDDQTYCEMQLRWAYCRVLILSEPIMRASLKSSLVLSLVAAAGCYHATIQTGLTPSTQTIERHWASSWIDGLVPPSYTQTASACPSGVARVDTQLSFPNLLVGFVTFGIYTPMDIVVTCGSNRSSAVPSDRTIQVGAHATPQQVQAAMDSAAVRSVRDRQPMFIEF